uniref:Putative organic cation/carnitine transporter n=1 Tax=Ornithodoros turicata TaxID=34597 RepID=A0A2R5LBH7_9ACAR
MDVSSVIGDYGRFQRGVYLYSLLRGIPLGLHILVSSFFLPNVDHWCARPHGVLQNLTTDEWKVLAIPRQRLIEDGEIVSGFSGCSMRTVLETDHNVTVDTNSTQGCYGWEYGDSFYRSSVVEEWDLVCEDTWLRSLVQSVMMWGMLAGSVACSFIGDKVGRRPPIIASFILTLVTGVIIGIAPSFGVFLVGRAICGFGFGLGQGSTFCLLMEVIGPKQRTTTALAFSMGFAVGVLLLPGFAWVFQEWRHLQLAITAPLIIFLIASWFLPESPRWLVATGRMDEARAVILRAARVNGIHIEDIDASLTQLRKKILQDQSSEDSRCVDLLTTSKIRRYTAILIFASFTTGIGFYGLQLSMTRLGGDPYLNFVIAAGVEFPVGIACYIIIRFFRRRRATLATYWVSGICCVGIFLAGHDMLWLRLSFAMVGKFAASTAFTIIWIFAAEVFPTVLRTVGVGASMMATRVGAAVAPFLVELRSYTVEAVPMTLLACFLLLAGFLVILLPETFRVVLPDTVKETEKLGKQRERESDPASSTVLLKAAKHSEIRV